MRWLWWVAAAGAALAASWLVLIALAARLPPGVLRDLATVLRASAGTLRRLAADPRVPRRVKLVLLGAAMWVVSPIDLIPEFLPVIGPLDDVVVVALALRYAARRIPIEALRQAWTADPAVLDRLLGRRDRPPGRGSV